MLPFLKPKQLAATIIARQKPDGSLESEGPEGEHAPELMSHAEALVKAMHAKDAAGVADAMQNIHDHFNPEESDAVNEK